MPNPGLRRVDRSLGVALIRRDATPSVTSGTDHVSLSILEQSHVVVVLVEFLYRSDRGF